MMLVTEARAMAVLLVATERATDRTACVRNMITDAATKGDRWREAVDGTNRNQPRALTAGGDEGVESRLS